MKSNEIICVLCPRGCLLTIETEKKEIVSLKGNLCKKGIGYAEKEIHDPRRQIATTVPISGSDIFKTVSVKTEKPIPLKMIFPIMEEIRKVKLSVPINLHQIIIKNVLNQNSDIIATRDVLE